MSQSQRRIGFGEELRHYRARAGLTQEQLAERAALSRRGIADLERGARLAPYAQTIERLVAALGLSDAERADLVALARRSSRRAGRVDSGAQAEGLDSENEPINRMGGSRPPSGTHGSNVRRLRLIDDVEPARGRAIDWRSNLPEQSTAFIGRQTELAAVAGLLESSNRLLTLTGPAGVGKTRLALEAAGQLLAGYPDGVVLVELAPVTNPEHIASTCAAVLGVLEHPGADISASVADWLRWKHLLLVLDNCEHLVDGCARFADFLLRRCHNVCLLVTSREVLGIPGEALLRVPPLSVPDASAPTRVESVLETEAGALFADRARIAATNFNVTEQNAASVARICQCLDGIPLALELAAVRLRALSVSEVAARLHHRFELLTNGSRVALPQHRTLRALVEWSYELLTQAEQALFQRLAVFTGSWSLDAVEAICSGNGIAHNEILHLMARLIDKSLVQSELLPDGRTRYQLLETLREFALDLLRSTDSAEKWRHRHASYFGHVAPARWGPVWWCEETAARLAELERDSHNFRAALGWLIEVREAASAQQLAGTLTFFWLLRGRVNEGRAWLRRALDVPSSHSGSNPAHASALVGMAHLDTLAGDLVAAQSTVTAGLAEARAAGEAWLLVQALMWSGWFAWLAQHDLNTAQDQLQEALDIVEAAEDLQALAGFVRVRQAEWLCEIRDFAGAARLIEKNLELGRTPNFPHALFGGLLLVRIRFAQGAYREAVELLQESIALERRNGSPLGLSLALTVLSWARLAQGDLAGARADGQEALLLVRDNLGPSMGHGHLGRPIEALALVAAAAGHGERALRLAAAGSSLREAGGMRLTPNEQALVDRGLAQVRDTLGAESAATAWSEGLALGPDAAIEQALSGDPGPGEG